MNNKTNNKTEIRIFCENVKRLREKENLSKTDMAKLLGISVKSLNSIEKGVLPKKVSCDVVFKIYLHFGIVPNVLFSKIIYIKEI